jgi:amidohydrolase
MNDIKRAAEALKDETIELRRDFHQHPEIAFEEVRTSGIIAGRLKELGLEVRAGVGKTGVVGVLDSGRPGRTVLVRADIDALPVQEENETPYRSQVEGKMHACAHDGHAAVALSTAKLLSQEDFAGKLVFIFQPAEEIVRGAEAMLKDGALEGLRPDASIGLHLSSNYPTGTVAVRAGPAMAAADVFRLVVRGEGGHASQPHRTVDPILIASSIVTSLQSLVSRETDPVEQAVISITSIHGGTAYNIIPEEVELKGTLRTFKAEVRERLRGRIRELAGGVAATLRGNLEMDWIPGSPTVVNDDGMTERLRVVAASALGQDQVIEAPPIMGGDDMALWLERAPGCYFFVGARNDERGIDKPHHHPRFDIDEAALPTAVEILSRGALDFLASPRRP